LIFWNLGLKNCWNGPGIEPPTKDLISWSGAYGLSPMATPHQTLIF